MRLIASILLGLAVSLGVAVPANAVSSVQTAAAKKTYCMYVTHVSSSDSTKLLPRSGGVIESSIYRGTTRATLCHGKPRKMYIEANCYLIWNPWGPGRWEWYGYGGRWVEVNFTWAHVSARMDC